jgi:hypothetical protein
MHSLSKLLWLMDSFCHVCLFHTLMFESLKCLVELVFSGVGEPNTQLGPIGEALQDNLHGVLLATSLSEDARETHANAINKDSVSGRLVIFSPLLKKKVVRRARLRKWIRGSQHSVLRLTRFTIFFIIASSLLVSCGFWVGRKQ